VSRKQAKAVLELTALLFKSSNWEKLGEIIA
jgi:hypothetical protein